MAYQFKTKFEPFLRGYLGCEANYKGKRVAAGQRQVALEGEFKFDKNYLPLGLCEEVAANIAFGPNVYIDDDMIKKIKAENPDDAEELQQMVELMGPIGDWPVWGEGGLLTEQQKLLNSDHVLWGGDWMGHAVPAFWDVCKFGTDFYREKVAKYRAINTAPEQAEFYDSCDLILDTIDILGQRFYDMAVEKLETETDPDAKRKLENVTRTFSHAPKSPCKDFVEAVIVYVMMFSLDGVDSPGHFDQYMYDFWKVTDEQAREEYLYYIWEYFHDSRAWNLCIAGSDENGNDLTNDLTYAILRMIRTYKYQTPNVTFRWHKNTPTELMKAVYETLAAGTGLPALYNDHAVVAGMTRLGIPKADAHTYVMNGCNQIDIPGKSHMGLEDGEVSFAKVLELTLHNGISFKQQHDIGLHTGDPTTFETFDAFYQAFIKQFDFCVDKAVELSNIYQEFHAKNSPNPLRSVFIEGCIEKALDYKNRGPLYGNGQILAETIADASDSLAAIKKYVYEEKRFTMAELIDALKKDFVGYDEMYQTLKNSDLKFGNDNAYVDSIAADIVDHFNRYLLSCETFRGGHFSGGCSPFSRAAEYGDAIAALPNGKKHNEKLVADSIGATPGCDTNGPTALLNSCLCFDHTLPGSGFILNLKFDKHIFASAEGEETFLAMWRSYFERGGQMITATVVSADELLDAQIHPENHKDLIVRVGGYSDYFNNIEKDLQDNVIARTVYCNRNA